MAEGEQKTRFRRSDGAVQTSLSGAAGGPPRLAAEISVYPD